MTMILHELLTMTTVLTGILLMCTLALGPMLLDHEDDRDRLAPFVPIVPREEPILARSA